VEAFEEHLSSSGSVTDVAVVGLHGRLAVRPSADGHGGVRIRATPAAAVVMVERSGAVTLRRAAGRADAPIEVAIDVPPRCAITLRRVTGSVRLGDTGGALTLDLDGRVDVDAGRVESAHVSLRGDGGHVSIAAVEGRALGIDVIGNGRVRADGSVERLRAQVVGSGNVLFGGEAQIADLIVDGPGYINVLRVRRHLRRWCIGAGDARVSFRPQPVFETPRAGEELVGVGRAAG
jgi:hypothetical protein